MRYFVFLTLVFFPFFAIAQNSYDGYDASRGLAQPTYKQKAPPASVEIEKIIEESDTVLENAQSILEELGESTAPAPTKKPVAQVTKPPAPVVTEPAETTSAADLRLDYTGDQTVLENSQKEQLLEKIFGELEKSNNKRVFVYAHAASPDKEQSLSRRISLQRALDIESYLTSQGIAEEQIIILPLGNTQQNADRVNLEIKTL